LPAKSLNTSDPPVFNVFQPPSAFLSPRSTRETSPPRGHVTSTATAGQPTRSTPSGRPIIPRNIPAVPRPGPAHSRNGRNFLPRPLRFQRIRSGSRHERRGGLGHKSRKLCVASRRKVKEGSYRALFHVQLGGGERGGGGGGKASVGARARVLRLSTPREGEGAASRRERIRIWGGRGNPRSSSFSPPHFPPDSDSGPRLLNPAPVSAITRPPGDRRCGSLAVFPAPPLALRLFLPRHPLRPIWSLQVR
jgi:hypothetical protein